MTEVTAHGVRVVGESTPLADLLAAGLTDAELCDALGVDAAQLQAMPEMRSAVLGPTHAARVERALYAASLPGETWKESAVVGGGVVRLSAYRPPDTAAAKLLLPAADPERHGANARESATVVVLTDPDSLRALLGQKKSAGVTFDNETPGVQSGSAPPPLGASSV